MKTVVITGSSRGIGFGLADAFLALGCAVAISGRSPGALQRSYDILAAKYGKERLFCQPCDVTIYTQVQELWNAARAHFGQIDIWINNAGIAHPMAGVWELPVDEIRAVVDTNVTGAMYGTRVAMLGMLAQKSGAIYNLEGLGSSGGRKVKGLSIYGTTKAAMAYFNESLALETAGTPVITGAVRPGMVVTDMITQQYTGQPEEWEKAKRIFNILADRVETVTPWLAQKMLENQKRGAVISYGSSLKIAGRFLTAPFSKRKVIE
jgi:NAD(P)-dependent dehydrogenase (short-subunit alcohol dehydrogenase family)